MAIIKSIILQKDIFVKNLEKGLGIRTNKEDFEVNETEKSFSDDGRYVNNSLNRKLGRVGMPYPKGKGREKKGETKRVSKLKTIKNLPWEEGRGNISSLLLDRIGRGESISLDWDTKDNKFYYNDSSKGKYVEISKKEVLTLAKEYGYELNKEKRLKDDSQVNSKELFKKDKAKNNLKIKNGVKEEKQGKQHKENKKDKWVSKLENDPELLSDYFNIFDNEGNEVNFNDLSDKNKDKLARAVKEFDSLKKNFGSVDINNIYASIDEDGEISCDEGDAFGGEYVVPYGSIAEMEEEFGEIEPREFSSVFDILNE